MAKINKDLISGRIAEIRRILCDGKNKVFASQLGISEQNASSYCNGKIGVGNRTINRVLQAFPQVNRKWLVIGEGEMLNSTVVKRQEKTKRGRPRKNESAPINTKAVTTAKATLPNTSNVDYVDRLISIIESKDRHIEKLINMIDKLSLQTTEKEVLTHTSVPTTEPSSTVVQTVEPTQTPEQ